MGLDPGFKKLGVGILTIDGKLVECRNVKLRPDRKLNQG
jgi:Holliday junction resolvasome RuvABC endonuclease subunit